MAFIKGYKDIARFLNPEVSGVASQDLLYRHQKRASAHDFEQLADVAYLATISII
jgi:hypothetical protein